VLAQLRSELERRQPGALEVELQGEEDLQDEAAATLRALGYLK
jgi:hypothetical protein